MKTLSDDESLCALLHSASCLYRSACILMDVRLVSLRLQPPLHILLLFLFLFLLSSLYWWWWWLFISAVICIFWHLSPQHAHPNPCHRSAPIRCLHHEVFSCEPWCWVFTYKKWFSLLTGSLHCATNTERVWVQVQILRNMRFLSQVRFLMVVKL
jgi:hypothetical protein